MKPFETVFTAKERLKIELLALGHGARLGMRGRAIVYLCQWINYLTDRNARRQSREVRKTFLRLKANRLGISNDQFKKLI